MKNKKKLLLSSLLSLVVLAGCSVRDLCPVTSSDTAPGTSSDTTSQGGEESSTVEIATDIFGNVIPGLNKAAENKHQVHDYTTEDGAYSGEAAGYVDGNVAYGWVEYTVTAWYSTYGVAVKVTFDDAGKAVALQVGAPDEGVHNFTPSYAAGNGAEAYSNYLANLQKNAETAILGKTAVEIADQYRNVVADPSAGSYGSFVVDDAIVGAGATQTDSRLEYALYSAALVYAVENDYVNNNVIEVAGLDIPVSNTSGAVTGTATHSGNTYSAASIYMSWGSLYGISVSAEYDAANNTITSIDVGVPTAATHNFTPMYAFGNGQATYIDYAKTFVSNIEKALVGKTVNEALVSSFANSAINTETYVFDVATAFSSDDSVVTAGATQSYSRASVAIQALLNEIIANN